MNVRARAPRSALRFFPFECLTGGTEGLHQLLTWVVKLGAKSTHSAQFPLGRDMKVHTSFPFNDLTFAAQKRLEIELHDCVREYLSARFPVSKAKNIKCCIASYDNTHMDLVRNVCCSARLLLVLAE